MSALGPGLARAADEPIAKPHCGVVIDPALHQSPAAILFESSILQDEKIIPVERSQIAKVLHEEQLRAMFSADAIGKRSAFGQKVKADLLVMVRDATSLPQNAADPTTAKGISQRIDLIVCETKHGLRLAVATIAASSDAKGDAASLRSAFDAALARYRQNIRQIIAVPPFASQDLTHDFDYLEEVYPRLIGQTLLQRPGVLVVEISEAKALADELALTNSADIQRQLPFYLNGTYRHEGLGDALRVTINLEFKRGDQSLGKLEIPKALPSAATAQLISGADQLMKTAPDAPPNPAAAPVDNAVEAGELASAAKNFDRVGDWRQARILAEASLLLDSHQPQVHAVAFRALNELAEQTSGFWGMMRFDRAPAAIQYFRESLPHLEAYLNDTHVKFQFGWKEANFDIARYWFTVKMEVVRHRRPFELWDEANKEATAAVWRVLHRKSAARIDDDTAEYCFPMLTDENCVRVASDTGVHATDAEVAAAAEFRMNLLGEFAYRKDPLNLSHFCFQALIVEYDDPRWFEFLRQAQTIPNAIIAKHAADVLDNDLKVAEKGRKYREEHKNDQPASEPSVAPEIADAEVLFKPIVFTKVKIDQDIPRMANRVIGCMRGGPGVDIFWTEYLIFTMSQEGVLDYAIGCAPPRPKQDADPNPADPCWLWLKPNSGCFDGRLAWFFIELSPVRYQGAKDPWEKAHEHNLIVETALVAYDRERHELYWIGRNEGLPPGANAIAPLAPGKICVAGSFGRTWCGIASVELENRPSNVGIKVIYEARDVIPKINPPDDSLSIAYPIEFLQTLAPPTGASSPSPDHGPLPRVLARRSNNVGFLMIDLNDGSVKKFADPLLQTISTAVYGDQIYYIGIGPQTKLYMRQSTIADPSPKDPAWLMPYRKFIVDDGVVHLMDAKNHQWLISRDGKPPFRALRGYVPGNDFTEGTLTLTNHYGLTIVGHGDNHDLMKVEFPRALPEAAK